jgi:hypothetical protein
VALHAFAGIDQGAAHLLSLTTHTRRFRCAVVLRVSDARLSPRWPDETGGQLGTTSHGGLFPPTVPLAPRS